MNHKSPIDSAIADYYRQTPEERRLEQGAFLLEAVRTRELIQGHIPPPPGVVLDIGGAAGAYAFWLTECGYIVHLIDPIPRLVDEAQRRSATSHSPLASCEVGDARNLRFPDTYAHVVLLLGPLYHLTTATERIAAIKEAARALKPGGRLFAAAISRWASVLDGLARDLFQDPRFAEIADRDLRDGQHRNPTERLDYFTTAYFHRPEELRSEVAEAGLQVLGLYGIEGPGWILPDIDARMSHSRRRADLLRVARSLESESSLLGINAHLLIVAEKV